MDILTKEKRSWNMSRIRSKDSKPEKMVRSALHSKGFRFRLHLKNLPGSPDIVLPKYRTAIFVNGCFWHRHKECRMAYEPKIRQEFWQKKFQQNIRRDETVKIQLEQLHWKVMVGWECETNNIVELTAKLCLELQLKSEEKQGEPCNPPKEKPGA
jgi:DNA mismatch endonuclease, patch repair protein